MMVNKDFYNINSKYVSQRFFYWNAKYINTSFNTFMKYSENILLLYYYIFSSYLHSKKKCQFLKMIEVKLIIINKNYYNLLGYFIWV